MSIQSFDWHAMVSMNDIMVSIQTSATSGSQENNVGKSNAERSEADKVELRSEPSSPTNKGSSIDNTKEPRGSLQLSDAYRIRFPEKEGGSSEELPAKPLHVVSLEDVGTNMMNNICIIVSSSQLNASNSMKHSCITLQPDYLLAQNGSNFVSTLERILSHTIPNRFHAVAPFESSWESIRSSAFFRAENDEVDEVFLPLYGLVVLRMESAIAESYRKSKGKATSSNGTPDATIPTTIETRHSPVKAGMKLDLTSKVTESLMQLNSLPETGGAHLLRLPNAEQCLILPFHIFLREVNARTPKTSTHSSNDTFRQVLQQYFQQPSGDGFDRLSGPPAARKLDNSDDSSRVL